MTLDFIKNVSEYDPSKLNNKQLADDWRIILAAYANKVTGKW